ncbi:MAG: VacJ family lipoprotein [Burkholderiaceae bacterium]
MTRAVRLGALAIAIALGGCASAGANDPHDPLEGFNRAMFTFNDKLDQVALKPAATVYKEVTPSFVQTGIGNFFGNIGDIWSAINSLLQGNLEGGFTGVMRVAVNTVLGFGGVLDISSEAGLTRHQEDFGQTLGTWGVGSGPYLVLPLFGSSTLRDSVALPADIYGNIWTYKRPVAWRNVGAAVRVVDQRASVLNASNLLEDVALDRYAFVRDAYLQRRAGQVRDRGGPWSDDEYREEPEPAPESAVQSKPGGN